MLLFVLTFYLFVLSHQVQLIKGKLTLYHFETVVLNEYLAQFEFQQDDNSIGQFKFETNLNNKSVYGSTDMVHLLHFIGM